MPQQIVTPPALPEPYEFLHTLGMGTYGVVVLARDTTVRDYEKSKVAIKLIPSPSETDVERVARELMIHGAIRHRHIVPVFRCFNTNTHLGVVMEYIRGGRLFDLLNDHGPFSETKIRWFFRQLMDAVKYIHEDRNSMHRDIKLENIILADKRKQWPTIFLCDFGFARTRGREYGDTVTKAGSPNYFAPEILFRTKTGERYDGKIADIFSCGVVFYVLLYGRYPKGMATTDAARNHGRISLDDITIDLPLYQQIKTPSGRKQVAISSECLALLKKLLEPDPKKRITLDGIFRDPWFQKPLQKRFTFCRSWLLAIYTLLGFGK